MFRARFSVLVIAACLALACGCTSLCHCPLFGRLHRTSATTPACPCGDVSGAVSSDGPSLDGTPVVVEPPTQGTIVNPSPVPQSTMPTLAPPPRLVPQAQAQTAPYTPSKNSR